MIAPAATYRPCQDNEGALDVSIRGSYGARRLPTESRGDPKSLSAPTGKPYNLARGGFYALDSNAIINTNQSAFSGAHSVGILKSSGPSYALPRPAELRLDAPRARTFWRNRVCPIADGARNF